MRTRGSTSARQVRLVEPAPTVSGTASGKGSVELPKVGPLPSPEDWGGDINGPDLEKPLLRFGPTLVAEKSDRHNWTLKERKKLTSGPNAGAYRWNDLGYYGTPGQAFTRALRMEAEGRIKGQGVSTLAGFAGVLQALEFENREELQRTIIEETLQKVLGVVEGEEDKKRVQALLGRKRK